MNNGEVVDNLLDKGIVTNIGYHNDHDIAIGLPSFVFTDIENYVKLAEAVGLTSPISTPAAASGGVVIANI
ncbi:MAG: gas vesicle synthesis protein GvpA [bacterium]